MRSMLGSCYTSAILCLQATVLNSVLKQTIIKERLDAVLHRCHHLLDGMYIFRPDIQSRISFARHSAVSD